MPRPRTTDTPAKKRQYIVLDRTDGKPVALIHATSLAQTRNHIAAERFVIRYAEQGDVFAAAKAGLELVEAKSDADAE